MRKRATDCRRSWRNDKTHPFCTKCFAMGCILASVSAPAYPFCKRGARSAAPRRAFCTHSRSFAKPVATRPWAPHRRLDGGDAVASAVPQRKFWAKFTRCAADSAHRSAEILLIRCWANGRLKIPQKNVKKSIDIFLRSCLKRLSSSWNIIYDP